MQVGIVGCGSMGTAYARAFVQYGLVGKTALYLWERNQPRHAELATLGQVQTEWAAAGQPDVLILAVKPQDAPPVLQALAPHLRRDQVVLSIMAGLPLAMLAQALQHRQLIRAMPNTPAQFGMGITAYVAGPATDTAAVRQADLLLSATGKTLFLADEGQLDAVTALSGSGPAYFFYIVQAMIQAGVAQGLPEPVAALLTKETLHGAYHVMNHSGRPLPELIAQVASRGGTTEAALATFEQGNLAGTIQLGIAAATRRARELGVQQGG